MTHRGPFQPLPFCGSVICKAGKGNMARSGAVDFVAVVNGELTVGCGLLNKLHGWLFYVCARVLYFSGACNPVHNLSMVTAQHLFLFKERKRFGFSARIATQVITLLPVEFSCSFNCSSCSSLPLLKSANVDLLLRFWEHSSGCSAEASAVTLPCIIYARFAPSRELHPTALLCNSHPSVPGFGITSWSY